MGQEHGAAHDRSRGRALVVAVAAGILALCLAALSPVTQNGFVNFDDDVYLTANPAVQSGLTPQGVRWALTTTRTGNWHPLTWLSHMLDVELFGLRPAGHHAIGLALHAANALLLFALLAGLTGALWRPAIVAALFAVHPLHVESVAWASERKDLLASFFALLALLAWLRRLRRPGAGAGAGTGAAATVLYALALAAKPMPVTLPFLLLLLDWWPLGRWAPSPTRPGGTLPAFGLLPPAPLWREKTPLFLLAAASAAVTFVAQAGGGAMEYGYRLPLVTRVANIPLSYARYLMKTAWPADLAFFYPFSPTPPHPLSVLAALLLLVLGSVFLLRSWRRRPWLGVGWLWYLGTLVPAIGLVQVGAQALADRYTYLPLTGLFVGTAWAVQEAVSRRPGLRLPVAAACCALLVALAGLARVQAAVWRDSFSLARQALLSTQDNWLAHGQLATAHGARGDLDMAVRHYLEALAIVPRHAPTHNNLGSVYAHAGRGDEALRHIRAAVEIDPRYAPARLNLGIVLERAGRPREAEEEYRRAIALDPDLPLGWNNLGGLLLAGGRTGEAIDAYRRAIESNPDSADARFNLGLALLRGGDAAAAATSLSEAARLRPGDIPTRMVLGDTLLRLGRAAEAEQSYLGALAVDPGLQAARDGIARARRSVDVPARRHR